MRFNQVNGMVYWHDPMWSGGGSEQSFINNITTMNLVMASGLSIMDLNGILQLDWTQELVKVHDHGPCWKKRNALPE
nr:uncharacterized protein CTRU02_01136 [Colletotrichum truncatum]KAF6800731.1 hypothetical protein CTRU02_01136 [Colletotrichum truncatum]